MENKIIGLHLKAERIIKDVNPEDLANLIGKHKETYKRYEKGQIGIDAKDLVTILDYLKTDISNFFDKVCEDIRKEKNLFL